MRQVQSYDTADGMRYRVRYRLGGKETSETFRRQPDAEMFRDILGNGKGDRVTQALTWLAARQSSETADNIIFRDFFKHYVDQLTGITPRTRGDYRSMHRRYLGHLDHLPVTLITRHHVTTLVNELDAKGLATKTIKQTIHMLSTCLALAIDEGHISNNPCRNVRLPKQQQHGAVRARFLSYEEAHMLVSATPAHYRPLVTFLLGTGLRWSEATALEARHINLSAGTVRVEQAWKRIPGEGYRIGIPKSNAAIRTVNAATGALVAVAPLLGKPSDLVFATLSGGPVRHANFFNNVWQPTCKAAGFDPAPRLHDLRHTHASWLLSDGISIEAVQDQLGHESSETTRKVYAHLIPAVGVAVGKAASAAMQTALGDLLGQPPSEVVPLATPKMLETHLHDIEADA